MMFTSRVFVLFLMMEATVTGNQYTCDINDLQTMFVRVLSTNGRIDNMAESLENVKQTIRDLEDRIGTATAVHGNWSGWSDWGQCSATCNTGMQDRKRTCSNPRPSNGGRHCDGESTDYRLCSNITCEGTWSAWQSWSQCSESCGIGITRRNRTCLENKRCVGDSTDYQLCNKELCEGSWSVWQSWSQCSSSCGFGMARRSRTCRKDQRCVGDSTENQLCHEKNCKATDCYDIQHMGIGFSDDIFKVRLWRSNRTVSVYCDLTTDGGGWTVFQKRFNGSVDFHQNFANYTSGFGDLSGEFWLGLETVHEMTTKRPTELRIDLTKTDGTHGYEVYRNFYISTGPGYNLHNDLGKGTIGDGTNGLSYHSNLAFTTFDHDNDTYSGNCASVFGGGWWYKDCSATNLNGRSMFFQAFTYAFNIKESVMMFRPQF